MLWNRMLFQKDTIDEQGATRFWRGWNVPHSSSLSYCRQYTILSSFSLLSTMYKNPMGFLFVFQFLSVLNAIFVFNVVLILIFLSTNVKIS